MMNALGAVLSLVASLLLTVIYKVEAGKCYESGCVYGGTPGCRSVMRGDLSEDDCCLGNRGGYGYYDYMEVAAGNCYECFKCDDILGKIDGGWSEWSGWTDCTVICGGGERERRRACDNPQPMGLGRYCDGEGEERESCNEDPCPINGGWSDWTEWTPCSKTCGGGQRQKSRQCDKPRPQHGGRPCSGKPTETSTCNPHHCPVHGGWSAWGPWSACSRTCGEGQKTKSRQCDRPRPQHGGRDCQGLGIEWIDCIERPCPVHGGWSAWTEWGECMSANCSDSKKTGKQTKMRTCSNPVPAYGGRMCQGSFFEEARCTTDPANCPVDGGWTEWSAWACKGDGISRHRTCTNPAPRFTGKACVGTNVQGKSDDNCASAKNPEPEPEPQPPPKPKPEAGPEGSGCGDDEDDDYVYGPEGDDNDKKGKGKKKGCGEGDEAGGNDNYEYGVRDRD